MSEIDRVKTFNSTGIAPDGRLYAGDLNAIQDAAMGISDVTDSGFPIGGVFDWPWDSASLPSDCALCYGQAISRSTYSSLAAIALASSYPHGNGNGTSTFNLPDYRGRSGVGKDDMGGSAANRITNGGSGIDGTTLGAVGGAQTVTLSTSHMPVHSHGHTLTLPNHTHNQSFTAGGAGPNNPRMDGSDVISSTSFPTGIPTSNPAISGSISNAGSGSAHNNMPPSLIVNKAMKVS